MRLKVAISAFAVWTISALSCDPGDVGPGSARADPAVERAGTCEAACDPGAACCTERFIHGDGASVGWTQRGAPMFVVDDPEDATAVLARLKQWIAERPARAGLAAAMPDVEPLNGLTIGEAAPRVHQTLVLHRFAQTYRGEPVVGAGADVTLTLAPGYGAVSVTGAVIDARETFAGWDARISPKAAAAAAATLFAGAAKSGEIEPDAAFMFGPPRLVAIAEVRRMAWEIEVFHDGRDRGTLLLEADSGGMLAFSPSAQFGPEDSVAITLRARTFASDFFAQPDPDKQIVADLTNDPVHGGPLLGSSFTPLVCDEDPDALPECGEVRLGNAEIVVLDAQLQQFYSDNTTHPWIDASPSGEFLAPPPTTPDEDSPGRPGAALQDYFYRLQATYSLIHKFHAGHWDSNHHDATDFPLQLYKPRVILATNTDVPATCGLSQPGCTTYYFPYTVDEFTKEEIYDEHPEADLPAHVWGDSDKAEVMGFLGMGVDGFKSPDLVFHEFGHIVDYFTATNFIGHGISGSGCSGANMPCSPACVPDSTDEGLALAETVADMIDTFSVARLYTSVEYARCGAVSAISNNSGPVHDPTCIHDPAEVQSFADQRPTQPGFVENDGLSLPTGKCSTAPGYRQTAILQAWWEWIHGRECDPLAPFGCVTFTDEEAAAASGIRALLYAVAQTNATYYRKLFSDMELYIACTDGPERAATFRAIFCHHGILSCELKPPLCPTACGDGVAELAEDCDGNDLRDQTCQEHGLLSGVLQCDADCKYDTSQCTQTPSDEPSPTAPTDGVDPDDPDGSEPGTTSTTPDPDSASSGDSTKGVHAEDGCGCAAPSSSPPLLVSLALLLRRRRVDGARVQS